ncbi:TatD family deoxyribonuclease [Paenimyroides tangerinum]|uniref:TatD family deoxyribonuclease n=1 Tax=Paenimyroides tangerinum TaxID=2488728 RepID=A0A3P3WEF5_9FLAO|nr:TatD family hydrolase [Paenimyroides tangerinum]RRJ90943.1 TatD family deoxyribonuclease [Paenimyroides tangerinum]
MKYNIHTHHFSNRKDVVELVNQYPNEVDLLIPNFTVGIHPWYIDFQNLEHDLQIIEQTLQHPNCKALGECGLDKRIETPLEDQISVFKQQLLLAEKHKKAVILHCVSAYQEVIEIKMQLKITVPMIIHGFSKNIQVAQSLYKNGFYLSFGKYLLRNPELLNVLKQIPTEFLFLETDMIEETIDQVYAKAQSVLETDVEKLIEHNYIKVFNRD